MFRRIAQLLFIYLCGVAFTEGIDFILKIILTVAQLIFYIFCSVLLQLYHNISVLLIDDNVCAENILFTFCNLCYTIELVFLTY